MTAFDTLFDEHPIEIGGFTLRSRSVTPSVGKPTIKGWQAAMQYASASEESAPWWVGSLLAYAEDRADWREKFAQAAAVTKLAKHTLENYTTIARKVTGRARALAPTASHARLVTKYPPAEQERLLEQARDEGLTVSEFTRVLRAPILEGQAETMHTVDVTVRVAVEAETSYGAETAAWALVKTAVASVSHAHVIAAHASPHVGPRQNPQMKVSA